MKTRTPKTIAKHLRKNLLGQSCVEITDKEWQDKLDNEQSALIAEMRRAMGDHFGQIEFPSHMSGDLIQSFINRGISQDDAEAIAWLFGDGSWC